MYRKLMVFLMTVLQITACSAPGANISSPEAPNIATPLILTATSTSTSQPTVTPNPTATSTPIPSPTPLPNTLDGAFEFPFQAGSLPAVLEATSLGGVELGIIESMGGTIPTGPMKEQNLIPLARDGAVLNATSGNVTFLPFPERMLAETGQEIVYSPDRSGRGWAAYVDDLGILVSRMVTSVPNGAIIVAAVSYNADDLGTVYAVKLSPAGEVLGKAHLVFNATTPISVVFENGDVTINADNNPVVPNFESGGWDTDLKALLAQQGIFFPETTASIYLTENYGFSVYFSEGIFANSGFRDLRDANGNINIHIPSEIMDLWILQQMGRYMYFQRDLNPRFDVFNDVAEDVCAHFATDGNATYKLGNPVFGDNAREILAEGPVPLQFRWIFENISGVVYKVEFNFVSKAEFPLVHNLLDEQEINHAYHWPDPDQGFAPADYGYLYLFSGDTLVVYAYLFYVPSMVGHEPETAESGRSVLYYFYSINMLLTDAVVRIQGNLMGPADWATTCGQIFSADTYIDGRELCIFTYEGVLLTDCLEAADFYFLP